MGKLRCEGTYIDSKCKEKKCRQFAVTKRKWWRFGGQDKSAVVDYYIHLCARCADLFYESRREAAWEARAS